MPDSTTHPLGSQHFRVEAVRDPLKSDETDGGHHVTPCLPTAFKSYTEYWNTCRPAVVHKTWTLMPMHHRPNLTAPMHVRKGKKCTLPFFGKLFSSSAIGSSRVYSPVRTGGSTPLPLLSSWRRPWRFWGFWAPGSLMSSVDISPVDRWRFRGIWPRPFRRTSSSTSYGTPAERRPSYLWPR